MNDIGLRAVAILDHFYFGAQTVHTVETRNGNIVEIYLKRIANKWIHIGTTSCF